ncbi:unnamed protein product [Peniophora sp. CBMAI 1063]|nr:unnamed protein product [Peniophora sp. CBMAI 1063]
MPPSTDAIPSLNGYDVDMMALFGIDAGTGTEMGGGGGELAERATMDVDIPGELAGLLQVTTPPIMHNPQPSFPGLPMVGRALHVTVHEVHPGPGSTGHVTGYLELFIRYEVPGKAHVASISALL